MNYSMDRDEQFFVIFTTITCDYIIPIISLIGFLLNLVSTRVLFFLEDQERFYLRFIIVKVILEVFFCATGIYFKDFLRCELIKNIFGYECSDTGSYNYILYRVYIYKFLSNTAYFMIGLNEIYILYDRYLILTSKYNWFSKQKNTMPTILITLIGNTLFNLYCLLMK